MSTIFRSPILMLRDYNILAAVIKQAPKGGQKSRRIWCASQSASNMSTISSPISSKRLPMPDSKAGPSRVGATFSGTFQPIAHPMSEPTDEGIAPNPRFFTGDQCDQEYDIGGASGSRHDRHRHRR